jgi:hypothetical protein
LDYIFQEFTTPEDCQHTVLEEFTTQKEACGVIQEATML